MHVCLFETASAIGTVGLTLGVTPQLGAISRMILMALMFFGFYTAAFAVGSGSRRMLLGMGLAAVYLCAVSLSSGAYSFLYLGGIVWVLTNLCPLEPKPARQMEEREQAQ